MNENYSNLENLLNGIEDLKKDKHSKEEEFNAYQIFRLNDKEVMHSRFIGSLLNPKQNHGFKNAFLELFLQRVGINGFDLSNVVVECEKNTHNNRYIDIAIENKKSKQMIIIENKIWASDLDNQLSDYYQFGLNLYKESKNIYMIYLTPYGKNPGANSFPKDKEQPQNGIQCISYEKHILDWLDDCLKLIGDKNNRLYLCIEMYIELICKTINRNKFMEEILKQLINNPAQMSLAIDVVNSLKGRNFLDESESREIIITRIEAAIHAQGLQFDPDGERSVGSPWYSLTMERDGQPIGDICFTGAHIYAKTVNGTEIKENQIICNEINDSNLYNLLTNNENGINEWLKEISKTLNL